MGIKPNKGGNGSGNGSSTPAVDAYGYKYFTDLVEVTNTFGTYGGLIMSAVNTGSLSQVYEAGYDGQISFSSTTTSLTGANIRFNTGNSFPKTGDIMRIWIKMPATIDANSVINFGFLDAVTATPANINGIQITGNSCRGIGMVASSSTLANNPITVNPSSRYCLEIKYTTDTNSTVKVYDSTNGTVLHTADVIGSSGKRVIGMTMVNSGTVAKELCTVDACDLKLIKRGTRFPDGF